jgi:short-subunit dehydrogenase
LVTGATGGLGDAIARACAARGAHVVVTGRDVAKLRVLGSEIGAQTVASDLTSREDMTRLVEVVGDVDVLVSNAALPAGGRVETFSRTEIDRALDVNLRAPMVLSRAFVEGMVTRGRGHVVFVSSLAAAFATPGLTIYNTTKTALAAYALSLRGELVAYGVGVSVVYPGPIRDAGMWADAAVRAPMGLRTRSPADVARAVVRTIEHDRAEAFVAPLPLRVGAVFGRAFPGTFARLAPRLGANEVTEAMATALRHKR